SSLTVPSAGAGTSIVALSDSNVTSGSSRLTLSPGLTITSMIGTSTKSPMSGTLTSVIAAMSPPATQVLATEARDPRNPAAHGAHQTVQGAGASVSILNVSIASVTLAAGISPSSASAFNAASAT